MNIEDYIATHCNAGIEKLGSQLLIRSIKNQSLNSVVLVLKWITGLTSLHQASRPLIFYSVECLRPTVYDWCTSLLANMKSHLTECKLGRKSNFRFTSILCSFFIEWVLGLGPRVEIVLHGTCNQAMALWTEVMRQQGGGRVSTPYNDKFFFWWSW
jgi:hypothetical protein